MPALQHETAGGAVDPPPQKHNHGHVPNRRRRDRAHERG
jgi:hypothetical protein